MAPPACNQPGPAVLSRNTATGKFTLLWGAADPNRAAYEVTLEYLSSEYFTNYEVIESAQVLRSATKHVFKTRQVPLDATIRATVRTICKDCKESLPTISNELGPY